MKQLAVEWLLDNLISEPYSEEDFNYNSGMWDKAKEMENKVKLRNQLFIGKVTEVLGFDETLELMKQCYKEYPI
jgi:hypothetical protein